MSRFRLTSAFLAALVCASALPASQGATVATFTGGDPGDGLDLQGNFTYAVNIGTPGAAGRIGDADFTADDAPGVVVDAQNEIGGWITMALGDSTADQRIGFVLNSIRWSAAPNVVTVRLRVEKDIDYKLQLLFAESCCSGRGFNVLVNGQTEAANLMAGVLQAGDGEFTENRTKVGVVVTHTFKAASDQLTIVLDGPAADDAAISDRNAILNGLTLERLSPVTDTDADGLRDDWEVKYFNGLSQPATGDPDEDGLTNLEEQTLGTDPSKADTDGDTLTDGAEVRTHRSDPNKKDTDSDGLSDGDEVNRYQTNPTLADSDGDGTSDSREISLGSNPADATSKPLLTTIGVVTGGDAGEGLDLDGTFPYALAVGAGDEAYVTVRDASFVPVVDAEIDGVNLVAGNRAPGWYPVQYGATDNDANLAVATRSIRWSDANSAVPEVVLTLNNLEIGAEYKIQMLFGEDCCNRGFDVRQDDRLIVKDFNPGAVQGGIGNRKQEALITRIHFAQSSTLTLRFDGRTATTAFTDHNAILNAVTVERVAPKTDTDSDGIPDGWERLYYGGLAQTATSDSDQDGRTTAQEYAAGSDPTRADSDRDGLTDAEEAAAGTDPTASDTDGDGLRDSDEIKIHKTNPTKADSDDDGLSDGAELNIHHTDPTKADTDGDTVPDGKEVASGSDPLKAEKPTEVRNVVVGAFTGGDPGEGLDLQGRFIRAVNVSSAGAAGKAGDADFTADTAAGTRVVAANNIANWSTPEYGDSPADNVIEKVTQSIRYDPRWRIELANLIPGSTYKLQLLFYEQCCAGRGFNILVDGELVTEAFMPAEVQGGVASISSGAVVSAEITTYRDRMVIVGDGPAGRAAAPDLINDTNAILDAFTLEVLKEGVPTTPPTLSVARSGAGLVITFEGTLQAAPAAAGPYSDVAGSGPFNVAPGAGNQFFRAVRK